MRGTSMGRGDVAAALLGATLLSFAGCGSSAEPPSSVATVIDSDSRYQITLEASSPDSSEAVGHLRVRVDTRNDWHVADDAPAWFRIDETAGLEIDAAGKREPEKTSTSDRLDFAWEFTAATAGEAIARGQVKFGLCEGDDDACTIVKRDLELPLKIAFEPGS